MSVLCDLRGSKLPKRASVAHTSQLSPADNDFVIRDDMHETAVYDVNCIPHRVVFRSFICSETNDSTCRSCALASYTTDQVITEAHRRANSIWRCFVSGDIRLLVRAFVVYVRSVLENYNVGVLEVTSLASRRLEATFIMVNPSINRYVLTYRKVLLLKRTCFT